MFNLWSIFLVVSEVLALGVIVVGTGIRPLGKTKG